MELSVVVPTLNAASALSDCLDALAEDAPAAERIVVDGPSADGTSGMVTDRDDVDVLVELADRGVNAARNAGIAAATGQVVAFVDGFTAVRAGWRETLAEALENGADVVTGPVRTRAAADGGTPRPERRRIAGRDVTYFDGGNVAFDADLLDRLDGFDEYLAVGGARDLAHRVAGFGGETAWVDGLAVDRSSAGGPAVGLGWKYRSLAYRLAKNYGLRPSTGWRTVRSAIADGWTELHAVRAGERAPSAWLGDGRDVSINALRGTVDGWLARRRDRSPARNPNGLSDRGDRAVHVHDWRAA
ncbi:MAG: glycosyltransferase [Halobacteriales archaeon]